MCPLEATWSERMFGLSDVGAFLFRDDSSLVSSHNGTAEEWGPGGVDPAEMDAARSGSDTTRGSRAASGSSRRRALHPARSFRGRRARRAGHARGQFGRRRRDGRWVVSPGRGARVVRALARRRRRGRRRRRRGRAAPDVAARGVDARAPGRGGRGGETRAAGRDETRGDEATNVRASHETRLRALDARHRAALDAWKRDELTRARNAARKLVRDTEARAEGVVRGRALPRAAEARAAREASRAEAAEEEARATRARLDACLHRHSRVAAMRDASASRARSRLMRRRAFEAWRFFFATTASARAGDAESAGDARVGAPRTRARRATRSRRARVRGRTRPPVPSIKYRRVRVRGVAPGQPGLEARRRDRGARRRAASRRAPGNRRAYRAARADAARSAAFREGAGSRRRLSRGARR